MPLAYTYKFLTAICEANQAKGEGLDVLSFYITAICEANQAKGEGLDVLSFYIKGSGNMVFAKKVEVCEVGPRDGFQNIKEWIPTETKLEVIDALVNAGFKKMQVTSFVHPKAIPQLSDSKEVAKYAVEKYPDVQFNALVPNLFGAKSAYESGIRELTYVISASERHNLENVKKTIQESFDELAKIREEYKDCIIKIDIGTVFGCPFSGAVSIEQVLYMIEKSLELGADEILLADTLGIANPKQMYDVISAVKKRFSGLDFGLHMHDTRGMALANILVALQEGVTKFDSAVGGLGGSPFAPGAAGNASSEDLVNMLHQMGIETDVN
ncbi:MAG: hydroxymethylglutaryl-CoA lyase, partial [Clostridia bacterium]|nr:hydroxymethylglutaryl-CoA lyase [Clostridia bacterium]